MEDHFGKSLFQTGKDANWAWVQYAQNPQTERGYLVLWLLDESLGDIFVRLHSDISAGCILCYMKHHVQCNRLLPECVMDYLEDSWQVILSLILCVQAGYWTQPDIISSTRHHDIVLFSFSLLDFINQEILAVHHQGHYHFLLFWKPPAYWLFPLRTQRH